MNARALFTATLLLVAAPAAQAGGPPVVDVGAGSGWIPRFTNDACIKLFDNWNALTALATNTPAAELDPEPGAPVVLAVDPDGVTAGFVYLPAREPANPPPGGGEIDPVPQFDGIPIGGTTPVRLAQEYYAARFPGGKIVPLDAPSGWSSRVHAIDQTGRFYFGEATGPDGITIAAAWVDGVYQPLADLVGPTPGLVLRAATDVSEGGIVLVTAERGADQRLLAIDLSSLGVGGSAPYSQALCEASPARATCTSGCPNGDFEQGITTNWNASWGVRQSSNSIVWSGNTFAAGYHAMVTPGWSPQVWIPPQLRRTSSPASQAALQLGSTQTQSHAQRVYRTFVVDNNTKRYMFNFALMSTDASVASGGPHPLADQSFFGAYVYLGSQPSGVPIRTFEVRPASDPTHAISEGDVGFSSTYYFEPWRCHSFNLLPWLGQTVTVSFVTAGCDMGIHFLYAYIDDVCGQACATAPDFAMGSPLCPYPSPSIWADGSIAGSYVADNHFWSLQRCDANMVPLPGYTEYSSWYPGPPENFDLGAFGIQHGVQWACGQNYRVKLATSNECAPWAETVKLLQLDCPIAPHVLIPQYVPTPGPVIANGATSTGRITRHRWTLVESTWQWNAFGPEAIGPWVSGPPSTRDLRNLAAQNGNQPALVCGHYYRVKLVVENECHTWVDDVKLFQLTCL